MRIGYARVSTHEQNLDLQLDALKNAGCEKTLKDVAGGARSDRDGLNDVLKQLRKGDTLVVWKLDRLGRSLKHLIGGEQAGDVFLIGLQLVPGPVQGGGLIGGVLQFKHGQWQAVDEHHHIGTAVAAFLDDGKLVHRQPIVILRPLKIHQPHRAPHHAAVLMILHGHAIGEQAMEVPVAGGWCTPYLVHHLPQGVFPGIFRHLGVDSFQGCP